MLANLTVAWRTVVKRLGADWLIGVAAFTTIMLATVLLASGPIYADAVTASALQQSLDDAPNTESNLMVSVRVYADDYPDSDAIVRSTVADSFTKTGNRVFAGLEADAYEIAGQSNAKTVALASIQSLEDIESHATVVAGGWPSGERSGLETAVNVAAAEALGITVGDRVDVSSRRDASDVASIEVVGLYEPTDSTDPFWLDDPIISNGREESGNFVTFGPFIVTEESLLAELTPLRTNASWRVLPDLGSLEVADVDAVRNSVVNLPSRLDAALFEAIDTKTAGASEFTVVTGLPGLLAGMDRSLTVTRSSVLALLIQMAILAGYALVLTAGLLVDTRRTETALLRSRGTSPRQILTSSILEGVVITAPAVVLAPVLATWLLRILNSYGPLATIQLSIDPLPTTEAYALAVAAAILSIVALAWPAYRAARSFPDTRGRHQRQTSRSTAQRAGVDVALVAVAAVAFWQLQTLGPEISARVRGQFGIDPLLVLAPALGLLAGAVLGLRSVPVLARLAEWAASSRRSTVPALASWQVARRPTRYARSSLLLMMAIGIGFFAAAYSTTWIVSQHDQAAHHVGADIQVAPDRASGSSVADIHLVSAHEAVDGVDSSMPVLEIGGSLSAQGGPGQFVLLDAAKASDVVSIRPDLSPDFSTLMADLAAARPTMGSVSLPGEPASLGLTFEATEVIPEDREQCGPVPAGPETCFDAIVRVVLQDGNDQLHRVEVGTIPENQGPVTLRANLVVDGGTALHPVYPLSIVSIEIESRVAITDSRDVELALGPITVEERDGTVTEVRADLNWDRWRVTLGPSIGVDRAPAITPIPTAAPGRLLMAIETGQGWTGASPVFMSLRPIGGEPSQWIPVVVTDTFVETNFTDIGEEVRLPPLRIDNDTGLVVGTLESFPTMDPSRGETIIVDLPTYQMMGYEPGFGLPQVDSYWITGSGDDAELAEQLQGSPLFSFSAPSAEEFAETLVSDPVALGTIGALTVGFVAAAVFAAVGFAVSATVSARERMVEFALLRALGLSPRQLGWWLALEQGALVVVSLALGTLIGWILTATLLPMVTLTQDGGPANPDVIVQYPWDAIVGLVLAVVGVLGLIVLLLTLLLRRVGLGSLLRLGEE